MEKSFFREYLKKNIMVLDGALGTLLQRKGLPKGVCPELWGVENADTIIEIQKEYISAGSNAVYTFTLGGNRQKLDEFGLGDRTVELNRRLAEISKQAVGNDAFVSGCIGPTGKFVRPVGDMSFERAVEIYKEQIRGLLEGGVDFFVIETMIDIQEARAALIAVKELCQLPVCVCMTFTDDGYTLTGTDPITALITLQSLGADSVGCNCSIGPQVMTKVIQTMKPYAQIPLIVKPNAGIPRLVDNITVFDMEVEEFGSFARPFVESGANLIGGCCGTSPEYIKQIVKNIKGLQPVLPDPQKISILTSARRSVFIGSDKRVAIIGERINPTGKKKFQEELKEGKMVEVVKFAEEQIEKGAVVLDVNVGMPGIDEKAKMTEIIELLSVKVDAPLCIDSSSPEVIEAALRIYPGRALINSVTGKKKQLNKLLSIAAKYGAMFILLPLDDEGIPEAAEKRKEIILKVFDEATKYGFEKQDVLIDGLVMTVSSEQRAALQTLKAIEWCTSVFGCGSVIGLSNVSFGLPERSWINAAFLAMAVDRGLTTAIADPSNEMLMNIKMACDVLVLRDKNSMGYISHFSQTETVKTAELTIKAEETTIDRVYNAVVRGDLENIGGYIEEALKMAVSPTELVNKQLIPAINQVGQLYDRREYFLPQLIMSAETMKNAFNRLEPLLKASNVVGEEKGSIVIATVKGDIHDIGKNIVALLLENYGFEVHDLGKDVDASVIITKARETGAKIIGLSALMTTTMTEMRNVIELARKDGLDCKFLVGGAVVTKEYAKEIGADGYSPDAFTAVKVAKKLLKDN